MAKELLLSSLLPAPNGGAQSFLEKVSLERVDVSLAPGEVI